MMIIPSNSPLCDVSSGQGIGAGHVCTCVREARHPLDSNRPHACGCGSLWAEPVPDDISINAAETVTAESPADRIAEIRARAEAATPGPWVYESHGSVGKHDPMAAWIMSGPDPEHQSGAVFVDSEEDVALMAHARADVPWLLDEVEAGREALQVFMTEAAKQLAEAQAEVERQREALKGSEQARLATEQKLAEMQARLRQRLRGR